MGGGGGERFSGAMRKQLVTMWQCVECKYSNFRRSSHCRLCGHIRAYGARLVDEWWVASALPARWDQEPRGPLPRRGAGGVHGGGGGLGMAGSGSGGGLGGRGDGPVGAGGARPLLLRREEPVAVDRCPTTSMRQREQQRGMGEVGTPMVGGARNRWTAPPRHLPEDGRHAAPGTLDAPRSQRPIQGAAAAIPGGALGGGADGWTQGLSKIQRKRIRQRARRKLEARAGGEEDSGEGDGGSEEMEEDEDEAEAQPREPVRPYQPPPLPRLLCVHQAERLQRQVEKMQQDGSRPQLIQRAEKRLEEAKRMVREAGGPTERRLVFSILQEETKERRLRESLPKADKEVEEREAELHAAQQALDEARRKRAELEVKWKNSKARVSFLAAEKVAETLPQEQTVAVHEALQSLLVNASPALQVQARLVSDYFRAVAPLPARFPEEKFYELSDGETQDEAQAMEGVEGQPRQGTKRDLQVCSEAGISLPMPARSTGSLEEARTQLAMLRHQKLAAISAAFDKGAAGHDQVPLLAPAELSDRFDCELQKAMEQVRAYSAAEAEGRDPTPCLPSGGQAVPEVGEKAAGGAVEGGGCAEEERGGKVARTAASSSDDAGGSIAATERSGVVEERRGEVAGGQPLRTKWEQTQPGPEGAAVRGVAGAGPNAELECPGCGRGPMAPEALQCACECGAAVCLDCGEGGVTINSCLVCFERCGDADVNATEVRLDAPGPRGFAGTLSGEEPERLAPRRATPYSRG